MTEIPRIAPDVVHEQVGDEWVLVHLGTNRIVGLNPTAARFWELFAAGDTRAEIERTLLDEFDVSHEQLSVEIDALLAQLGHEGMVIPAA